MANPQEPGDRCARCGGAFHCGIADASPCACTRITLSADVLAALRTRYTGCLCLACLRRIAADPALLTGDPPPPH